MSYFKDKEPTEYKNRVFIANVIVAIAFFVIGARFWYLQVLASSHYTELSLNNSTRLVKSPAPRGVIYDRLGIKIAENRPGFDLYLVPEDVKDWAWTKEMLLKLVSIDDETIEEKLQKAKGRPPFQAITLKEDLTWDETVKIESYKFEMPGIILDVAPKRSYLFGEANAHLIGYLGEISEKELKEKETENPSNKYRPGDLTGKYGLEKAFESDLRGIDGGKEVEVDALGRKIKVVNYLPPYPGNNIKLTIDIKTQVAAWAALKDKVGAAVAIEPSTGKVLAMVSTPTFDPNALSSGISKEDWQELIGNPLNILNNRAIQGLYPPASTFKPIHAAAALEEKVITPSTMIYSGPAFRFGNRDYRDWKEQGHGIINVHRAIVESSDTFFYQVGLKLGIDRLARYTKGFGFGQKTGIPLHNEKSGLVPSSEWKEKTYKVKWYEGETISVSVGQGYMLTTPLQLCNAYAAIANGGTILKPQIIEEIKTPAGEELSRFTPEARGTLAVSPETLSIVKDALRGVVHDDGGTAHFLKATNLKIAGKTGTAQVAKLIKRTKNIQSIAYKYRDHAWFAGFAPYDDPKIAVVVIVEHGGFGASAAAPVARELFKAYLTTMDEPEEPKVLTVSAPGGTATPATAPGPPATGATDKEKALKPEDDPGEVYD
ncbi:MAG: penicillin-binding protein 2 [Deltaproteobacteria bacterium]|nr:penicillin-binding protein 2 [Deltaproteobacteria bacterium]